MSESTLPSGIREDKNGTRFVGGTVRSDGTVRKVYKVRPGYVPQEDVAKYVAPKRSRAPVTDNVNRVASPHLRTINNILSGGGDSAGGRPSLTRQLKKTEDEFPALGQKPPAPKPVDAVVDMLSSLDINEKDKKISSRTHADKLAGAATEKTSSRVSNTELAQSESKSEFEKKSGSKSLFPSEAKTKIAVSSISNNTTETASTASNDMKKPAAGKYIPPWKRDK
jgi:partner of Y14 and mago protein